MEDQGQSSQNSPNILLVMLIVMIVSLTIGAGIFYWQNQALKKAKEEIKQELSSKELPSPTAILTPALSPAVSLSPSSVDPYAGWLIYTNDVYGYQFKYPARATIEEAPQEAFSLSPEEVSAGMSFEEKYARYTGKICLTINYNLGYVQISAPVNSGFAHVICGRTGRAYEGPARSETLTVDSRTYTASGFEERGPGETLNFHNETLMITLDDGTRIEYGSRPDETATFVDYQRMREDLIKILESYRKI